MNSFLQSKSKTVKRRIVVPQDQQPPQKKSKTDGGHQWSNTAMQKVVLKATGYTNCSHFADIRPIKKIDRSQFPDCKRDGINIFIYNAEYGWSREYGTLLQWYGIMENTNAFVYAQIHGFDPHFMVYMGDSINEDDGMVEDILAMLEKGIIEYLNRNIVESTKKYERNSELGDIAILANNDQIKLIKRWRGRM